MSKHPIDIAIVVLIATAETLLRVSVVIIALILTIANWQPKSAAKPSQTLQAPFVHPLYEIGEELESFPAKALRSIIGTKSRHAKHKLIAAYVYT